MFLQAVSGKVEDIRTKQDVKAQVTDYFATDDDVLTRGADFIDNVALAFITLPFPIWTRVSVLHS